MSRSTPRLFIELSRWYEL